MPTLDELLPLIDALSPEDQQALARHLSGKSQAAQAKPMPKKRVITVPSGRGGGPIARVVMSSKKPK
jgi:hypothetical protein